MVDDSRVRVKILQPAHNNEAIFSERSDIQELWRWLSMMVESEYWEPIKVEIAAYKEPPKVQLCPTCGAAMGGKAHV